MEFSNTQIARKLREVAAAYALKKGNLFQIRAYETAADAIEHSTSEVKDLWEDNNLDQIPSIGESLKSHLNELFKTGKVKHWEAVKKGIPSQVFEFLDIPGVGPQIALKLIKLGVESIDDLQKKIKSGELVEKGFSAKIAQRIISAIQEISSFKKGRMLLPYAFTQAERVLAYLKKSSSIEKADVLGSLRRMVATVGDLDFAVASKDPEKAVAHIIKVPGVSKIVDQGETKVTLALFSGLHLDFLIVDPSSYGSLLQHFTGSKQHNIHLREIAQKNGLSLSEYGVKNVRSGRLRPTPTENELYGLLKMETPPPELREDMGEIEVALEHRLPKLVELKDIKGDLHIHSDFSLGPSHGPGANSIEEIIGKAKDLGYSYVGISDHPPSFTNHTHEQILRLVQKRSEAIEQINYSQKEFRVLNLLEVDILPDGTVSVPDEGLKMLDFAIAGVHSSHKQPKDKMTERILSALKNPYVKVLTHPTGRLLNERESYEVDWPRIFDYAAKNKKALEINAYPNRLDLTDTLVREAKKFGVKFVVNSDAHEVSQMEVIRFGVAVARRGWATREDIINSWDWKKLTEWFIIS